MALTITKPIHSLVIDANAILRNDPPVSTLLAKAEQLFTVPAVIEEIRDAEARSRLQTTLLPFLKLRTPTPASFKIITDFARRTGDLDVLSKADIQILALARELECERNHGDWRLRNLPGQQRTNGPPPASLISKSSELGEDLPKTRTQSELEQVVLENKGLPPAEIVSAADAVVNTEASHPRQVATAFAEEFLSEAKATPTEESANTTDSIVHDMAETSLSSDQNAVEEVAAEEDDEDEEGWITPSNLAKHQEADNSSSSPALEEPKIMQVATITSDYAMQNVALRMNLNILSTSFQRIRQLKTWVLRCHACFDISKDMSRQFCKKCGGATMLRVSCSTDKDGKFQVHLKRNMQWNNRGNVFSIPKPVAGSTNGKRTIGGGKGNWGSGLILAEDQKEYVNAITTEKRRKEKDLMDEDYLPNILSGDRRGPQGRPKVGAGRNVNAKKRH